MEPQVVERLVGINRQFYQSFASTFSETRQRLQPGVSQILRSFPNQIRILDLGCGNGNLWYRLAQGGHMGTYVGLDSSPALLEFARQRASLSDLSRTSLQAIFLEADLSEPDWDKSRKINEAPYDCIVAFAVLHHLPGEILRVEVLEKVRQLLLPGGRFIHSVWQFLNSPRLQRRIQAWEKAGLDSDQVDSGDYLLDWRRAGYGLRYVHHFSIPELGHLAQACGFRLVESYFSDGASGNLGLYQVWEK